MEAGYFLASQVGGRNGNSIFWKLVELREREPMTIKEVSHGIDSPNLTMPYTQEALFGKAGLFDFDVAALMGCSRSREDEI